MILSTDKEYTMGPYKVTWTYSTSGTFVINTIEPAHVTKAKSLVLSKEEAEALLQMLTDWNNLKSDLKPDMY